jgi:hypothetical protein
MIGRQRPRTVIKTTKVNTDLVIACEKKMKKDKAKNRIVTWKDLWEAGLKQYLKEK